MVIQHEITLLNLTDTIHRSNRSHRAQRGPHTRPRVLQRAISIRPLNKWAMTAHQFGISEAPFGTEDHKHYKKKRAAFGNSFSRSSALKRQDL